MNRPPDTSLPTDTFDQRAFAVSAASLLASHSTVDKVWDEYFDQIPKHQPELRTVLIEVHRRALRGEPHNTASAAFWIQTRFDVADVTAKNWLAQLRGLDLLVRVPSPRLNERFLVPSEDAKQALFKIGLEYAAVLYELVGRLKIAVRDTSLPNVQDLGLLSEIVEAVELDVVDYRTSANVDQEI